MDLATLITTCAVAAHANVTPLLHQIAHVHDGDPYAVEVVDQQQLYRPETAEQAAHLTAQLSSRGHHLRVGLTHLDPVDVEETYAVGIEDLFADKCRQIQITADQLQHQLQDKRSVVAALASYYAPDANSEDEYSLSWSREVLSQPAHPDDVEEPLPHRYNPPADRLFATESTVTPDSTDAPELFIEKKPSSGGNPKAPPSRPEETSEDVTGEPVERAEFPSDHSAQPDVTDDTLPTTEELEQR